MLVFLTLKGTLKQSTVCCGMSKNSTWSVYFSQFQNLWWIQLLRLLNDSTKEKFLFGCFKPLSSSWSPVDSCSQWVAQPATSDYWLFSTVAPSHCNQSNIGEFYHYIYPVLPPELSYLDSRVLGATCLKRQTFAHSQGWSLDWIACLSRRNCSSARPYVAELFFECETNKQIDK